jgi:hypothetical protein
VIIVLILVFIIIIVLFLSTIFPFIVLFLGRSLVITLRKSIRTVVGENILYGL